jgi:hypothetical protein
MNSMRGTSEIYTELEVALSELERRQKSFEFPEMEKDLLVSFPRSEKLRLSYIRNIHTPNHEFNRVLAIKDRVKNFAEVQFLEFTKDKLVARNAIKYHLARLQNAKPPISTSRGDVFDAKMLVDMNKYEGKYFSEIQTKKGLPLVDFHHELLKAYTAPHSIQFFDISDWFITNKGVDDSNYYYNFLLNFVRDGIWLENFDFTSKYEHDFFHLKILPSFKKIEEKFGLRPLIVRILPVESEDNPQWSHYGPKAWTIIKSLLA